MININLMRRIGILLIGVIIMTFGGTVLLVSKLGGDSILVFEQGFAELIGLKKEDIGIAVILINVFLSILVFFIDKKMINIGTLVVTFAAGPLINLYLASNIIPIPTSYTYQLILSFIGCIICSFGVSLYIYSNIGYAPFEGIMMIISKKYNKRFAFVKIISDVILFGLGYLMGGVIGEGSVLTIIIFGPTIDLYLKLFNKRKNKNIIKPV